MNTLLYIVWNEKQAISIPILDEQHHAIVATINTLYFFINQGWGLSALAPTLKMVKSSVGFHLKTEEGILETLGADEELISKHKHIYPSFLKLVDHAADSARAQQDPMVLLKFLKDWWINHHEKEHLEYEEALRPIVERD